jgi:hypothetical protein
LHYQFKIQLQNISKPPVWRKVLVPGTFNLDDLHNVIQCAFGWDNDHLYQFSEKGYGSPLIYAIPNDYNEDAEDSTVTLLSEVFVKMGQTYTYIYDFGDDWVHKITVEAIHEIAIPKPKIISGKGTCPPEDCGGPFGYLYLLEVLSDPKHEEYRQMMKWLGLKKGEAWETNNFILSDAQELLDANFK